MTLYFAAAATIAIGLAHSILGERYILMRLFRSASLPHLFGGESFTRQTLRFAWHITTVAWFGFAALMVLLARSALTPTAALSATLTTIAVTFLITAAIALVASRGRHFAWPVFLFIGGACWYAATA
ncbi:MAG: hypothetical protein ACR2QV_01520 [Gammaproteobacteria bacterium]